MSDSSSTTTRPPRRGRLLRFSLRTLLVFVTLLAIGLAMFVHWREGKRREEAARQWVLDHGGSVAQLDGRPMSERPLWVQRLALVLPDECLRTVYWVNFRKDVTDADLAILRDLPNLTTLHLNQAASVTPEGLAPLAELRQLEVLSLKETQVGDAGLAHARGLHGLKELWIQHTGVTDASLPWIASNRNLTHLALDGAPITDQSAPLLAQLQNLEVLALRDTQITSQSLSDIAKLPKLAHLYLMRTAIDDEGLKHLEQMPSLQTLDVRFTGVSDSGVERLRQGLPNCRWLYH